jgi:sugar transferase (PEP-CTERM/EpsH1 system associated)
VNLLFLTPQLPHPPRQGTAIRNWGLIKSLSARHAITLLTFAEKDELITPELRAACQQVETVPPPRRTRLHRLRDLFLSPLPDLAHRLASPAFTNRLNALLQANHLDAMFVEGLELASSLITNYQLPITIFDAHNCETILQRRAFQTDLRQPRRWPAALYSLLQSRKLARFEAEVCRRANHVTCVSAEDAAALRALAPSLNPIIVPNGIFLADYTQQPNNLTTQLTTLVFTGKMDYRPNIDAVIWFANSIFPLIRRQIPDAEFVIVGQKPTKAVWELKSIKGIVVTGAVEDARTYIGGATVYVAPLRMGGGTRFKLLEALALRRPIVSTTLGAEGFTAQNGRELCLADTAADFAEAVVALLRDPAKRQALGEAGREFVKQYDWEALLPGLENGALAAKT